MFGLLKNKRSRFRDRKTYSKSEIEGYFVHYSVMMDYRKSLLRDHEPNEVDEQVMLFSRTTKYSGRQLGKTYGSMWAYTVKITVQTWFEWSSADEKLGRIFEILDYVKVHEHGKFGYPPHSLGMAYDMLESVIQHFRPSHACLCEKSMNATLAGDEALKSILDKYL